MTNESSCSRAMYADYIAVLACGCFVCSLTMEMDYSAWDIQFNIIIIIIINGFFSVALSNKVTARSTIGCQTLISLVRHKNFGTDKF